MGGAISRPLKGNGTRHPLGWRESQTAPEKLYGPSLDRLRAIKAEVDPDNIFQSSHPL